MKASVKFALSTAAVALTLTWFAAPASATGSCFIYCPPPHSGPKHVHKSSHRGGPWIVGCVMGSAAGLISASIVKAGGLQRMSQKEFETTPRDKTKELTSQEAALIGFTCGLGAFPVMASFRQQPAVQSVTARY